MSRLLLRVTTSALFVALASARLIAAGVQVLVKDIKGATVPDAVVSLVPLDTPPVVTPPEAPVPIAQDGQEFDPYVTTVVTGTRVSFPNHDKISHQVYSLSRTKPFSIPLYGPGAGQTLLFDKPGIVALGCNIHDWMSAYIVVLGTPHYQKTPPAGTATFATLPPGRYRLEVWHPRLIGENARELTVAAGDAPTQTIAVTLKPAKNVRRAPESMGAGYK
jgi:plastocyanin